jgi:putative Holliday junction resolvase
MARILAIDYGKKRSGIAVTDPMQIIAHPLDTIDTKILIKFLENYIPAEDVIEIVIGYPKHLDNTDADIVPEIKNLAKKIAKKFPKINIEFYDERYTSKRAMQSMIQAGIKKKDRRKKGNIDKIAATIILQDYLETKNNS